MDNLIPLQHEFYCQKCEKFKPRALNLIRANENRVFHTCLECGMDYIMQYPELDEIRNKINNYPIFENLKIKGQFPLCHI